MALLDMEGNPRVDDPGLFLLNSEEHQDYFRKLLGIYHWIRVKELKDIDHTHMNEVAEELKIAEAAGHSYVRFAIERAGKPSREILERIFAMRHRFDLELKHRSMMWVVGGVYEFNADLRFQRLRSNGAAQSHWSDPRSYIMYDFRMIGIEDLAGVTEDTGPDPNEPFKPIIKIMGIV